ncbi:uncharacterized protein LOC127871754 [Dreissena polymorpha]|uniref:BTB domain-containing protein n=1 Tax=Dreissena polymorpha TaxID=45954 RepID=A0A9D4LJX3_DREPO|nr:uncharacterized protein LOC127871754 [Dreissena polymorpha]KAH3859038.1 hypothetical protein DPMN_101684 [Dreissena polymorpha]
MSEMLRNDMESYNKSEGSESSDEDSMESIADEPGQSKPTISYDFTVKTWKDDIAFIIENKRIYAAKVVLALTSPVFEAMFGSEFTERYKNEVELPGKHFDSFHEFLCCLYPNIKKAITIDNVYKVLPLADEYQIKSLKKKCEKFLLRFINGTDVPTEKVLACLSEVSLHNLSSVKECCISKLLEKNPEELVKISNDLVSDDILALVLKKVVSKQQTAYGHLHTRLVKSYMLLDMSKGFHTPELQGFDHAIGATISHTVTNVSKLKWQKSKQITLWNFKFNAFLKISPENFGFFLQCEPPDGIENWSCVVKGILILKKHSGAVDKNNRCLKISHTFTPEQFDWGFGAFEKMERVLNPVNGYIKDDRLKVKIHFLANKPNWVEPSG